MFERFSRAFLCKCILLSSIFLNLLGFTMIGPINPSLKKHFHLSNAEFGALSSAFPFGMLFSLFLWPALSDSIGRKRVFVFCLIGVGSGLLLQSMCIVCHWSFRVFYLLRFSTGVFSSLNPVAKAYLGDVCTTSDLSDWMARREAVGNLSFLVGPIIGGFLLEKTNISFVIGTAACASLGAGFMVYRVLEPVPIPKKNCEAQYSKLALENEKKRYQKAVASICTISFLYHVGQATFDAFVPTYIARQFELGPQKLGIFLTGMACLSLFVATFVYQRLEKMFGLRRVFMIGAGCVAFFLLRLGSMQTQTSLLLNSTFYAVGVRHFIKRNKFFCSLFLNAGTII